VEALNRGVKLAGCMQNTGEGGIARHHAHGGDLVWQLGTGYFGARDEHGRFSLDRLKATVERLPVRMIEIKISQGAKPGLGGVLPAVKVTREISEIRGVPMGRDCISPASHSEFKDVDQLLDFVERIADATGLPVGLKSAVGDMGFWKDLARLMATSNRGVDFITIDGGEGGTGAAPLVFADHVALPFKVGFSRVYRELADQGVHSGTVLIGSGKLGFPHVALLAMALGCDLINVAREAMLSIGCIQAQRCHTGHCPTGVATQNAWLMRGLDPTYKAARFANYVITLRKEILQLSHACGAAHPSLVTLDSFDILDPGHGARSAREVFGYRPHDGLKSPIDRLAIESLMDNRPAAAAVM
jgi:glutamate synthase (ferredoxin)